MILYSATRFCTEFLRNDFPQIAGKLTTYHFQCLGGIVVGIIEMILAIKVFPKIKWLNNGFSYSKKDPTQKNSKK